MSLILDALKRLEAKAPPKPVAPELKVVESQPEVETATVLSLPQPSPEGGHAPDLENPAVDSEPIVLESVAISAADSPSEDWFEQTEVCLNVPELTEHDVDVQISLAALEGDVLNLDLEVRQPTAEAEIVEPSVEVQELAVEEPQNAGLPAGPMSEEPSAPVVELPRETLDFATEIAKLWTASDEEIAAEPAPPAAEFVSAELVEEEPVHDPAPDEIISFGTLEDEVLPINPDLPVGVVEEVPEDAIAEDERAEETVEVPESHVAAIEEHHEETVEEDAAEAEMPSDAILPIADFRPAVAELAEPERDDLVDDHDVLAAQLTELEFRGLRDNVLSQLPDAPAALLFAAADDETDVADVVLKLSQSLAQLRQGEVAIVCSTRLRDAYRASNDYGELQQAIVPSFQRQHRVPTVLIDAKDAGDRMVADLKRRCRWVLFAADAATARRWSPLCEATYVVVGLGNTDRRAAVQTVASLELAGGLVLGCVLTDVPDVA
jgi:hypothetical protein